MVQLEFSNKLKSISSRSDLIKSVKEQLNNSFENLNEVKGSIALITEICIAIESMNVKVQGGKKELFFSVYNSVFGDVSEVEQLYLNEIVDYLCETGAVYRRTRLSKLFRAVASLFR